MNRLYADDFNRLSQSICDKNWKKLAGIYGIMWSLNYIFIIILLFCLDNGNAKTLLIIGYITSVMFFVVQPAFIFSKRIISKKLYTEDGQLHIMDFNYGFRDYWKSGLIYILKSIVVFLWGLLFIVPGILKYFSYAMTEFIMLDHPEKTLTEAMKESKKMMKYHRLELFELSVSFFWYMLIVFLTFGIAIIWLEPRMNMSLYLFYIHISGMDQDQDLEGILKTLPNNKFGEERKIQPKESLIESVTRWQDRDMWQN